MRNCDTLDHLKRELSIVDPHNSTDPYYSIVEKICKMVTEKIPAEATRRMLVKTAHRVLSRKPLSPIANTPTIWELADECSGEDYPMTFVCKRCPSLYKTVYGIDEHTGIEKARYFDIDRVEIVDDTISYNTFLENIIIRFVHEHCPIEFPYFPVNKIKVFANIFGWNNPTYKKRFYFGDTQPCIREQHNSYT